MLNTVATIRPARHTTGKPTRAIAEHLGVVDQVRLAVSTKHRLAAFLGGLLGGFVPLCSFVLAHHELDMSRPLWTQLPAWLVLGGLVYSMSAVVSWSRMAFGSMPKALGFTVLLEGILIFGRTPWLTYAALAYLVVINAISASPSTACWSCQQTPRSRSATSRTEGCGAKQILRGDAFGQAEKCQIGLGRLRSPAISEDLRAV